MRRVARIQAVSATVLLLLAPAAVLLADRPSAWAFALHGIGATLMFALATMAMHRAYPLLRGGVKAWPQLRAMLAPLAGCALAQGGSGIWLLSYYHAEAGAGHALAQSAPLVDQLVMNVKLFCGLASILLLVAAWWSARLVDDEQPTASAVKAPALALAGGWILMVAALALGMAVSYVVPT